MEILIPLLIIATLIVLNGMFVAAEFGIVGVPRTLVERDAANGDLASKRISQILDDPNLEDQFIATAQLGITVSSLALGMYGEHVLAEWFVSWLEKFGGELQFVHLFAHTIASVLSIGILTYFHIVVGEMVPKSLALQQPHRVAKLITPWILVIQVIFFPFVKLLNSLGNAFLRLFGVRRKAESVEHYRTPEELALIVQESEKGGLLKSETSSVFQELLEFGDLTAVEAMVPRTMIVGIPEGASDAAIYRILREQPHSRYPVYSGTLDQVIGMVHVKDLLRCLPECGPKLSGIIRNVPFAPASATLEEVLKSMTQVHSQLAIVMDEQGGTAGLITVEDLFEEVVGEIREDAAERPEIYRDLRGRVRAAGTARIENVGEFFGVDLEHEEVDTVSGLILAEVGRPAEVGDVVEYAGVRFRVAAIKGRGVRECIVELVRQVPSREKLDV